MDLETINKNFEVFVVAEMGDSLWDGVTYTFEDKSFDGSTEPTPTDSWLRFAIRPGETVRKEFRRAGLGLRSGIILVDVFTPRPHKRQGAIYADRIESVFKADTTMLLNPGEPKTAYGQPRGSAWLQHLVTVSFWVTS